MNAATTGAKKEEKNKCWAQRVRKEKKSALAQIQIDEGLWAGNEISWEVPEFFSPSSSSSRWCETQLCHKSTTVISLFLPSAHTQTQTATHTDANIEISAIHVPDVYQATGVCSAAEETCESWPTSIPVSCRRFITMGLGIKLGRQSRLMLVLWLVTDVS